MNPPFGLTQVQLVLVVVGAVVVALLGLLRQSRSGWFAVAMRAASRASPPGPLTSCATCSSPMATAATIHLDFLLLTSRGIVVIDMRDITGNVFGGDQMTAWTLMSGPSRTTFVNPQAGLYDRIASVKAIATDTPIEGRIVFTKRAKFPKGLPRFTVMLESVAAEFPKLGAAELEIAVAKYRPGWARLKEAAKPSPHFSAPRRRSSSVASRRPADGSCAAAASLRGNRAPRGSRHAPPRPRAPREQSRARCAASSARA